MSGGLLAMPLAHYTSLHLIHRPRRQRGPVGKVTQEAVLAAALEVIGRDGPDALSMHRSPRSAMTQVATCATAV